MQDNATQLVVVGTGDHFRSNLLPALRRLEENSFVSLVATIDVIPRGESFVFREGEAPHYIRHDESLSKIIQEEITQEKPVVLLAHANEYHVSDALDLLTNGFAVLLEKPYALNERELTAITPHFDDGRKGVLLEYYLMMKAAPLLYGFGKIRQNSFYTSEPDLFISTVDIAGMLPDLLGDPHEITIDILEGEGAAATFEGRGASFVDRARGGGIINDLGIHALAPLFAIEDFIGTISYIPDSIRIAQAVPYLTMAREMGISEHDSGESYAEFDLGTSRGVSIHCRIGKYVLGRNERSISMKGSRGNILLDMNECVLFVNGEPALQTPKTATKYYPVLRAGIEVLTDNTPYLFNSNKVALSTQDTILTIRQRAYQTSPPITYRMNTLPQFP